MHRLDDLLAFVRTAELASFTQAATSLGLPKASVSAAVQRLEAALGSRLLSRTTRRVQLTPDGVLAYERCKDLLADIEELQTLFQPGGAALQGRLRLDMPIGLARHVVVPRLPEFLAAHPQLALELSSTDRRVDLVREGFDCVVRVGALADSSLVARPLGHYRQLNLASPAYLAAHGVPRTLDDLAAHRLVHYTTTLGARPTGFEVEDPAAPGSVRRIAMAGAVTVNNSDAYTSACLAGLGIIQSPAVALRPLIEAGALVEVLPAHRAPALPVSLLVAHRRQLPKRVHAVVAWLDGVIRPWLDA